MQGKKNAINIKFFSPPQKGRCLKWQFFPIKWQQWMKLFFSPRLQTRWPTLVTIVTGIKVLSHLETISGNFWKQRFCVKQVDSRSERAQKTILNEIWMSKNHFLCSVGVHNPNSGWSEIIIKKDNFPQIALIWRGHCKNGLSDNFTVTFKIVRNFCCFLLRLHCLLG